VLGLLLLLGLGLGLRLYDLTDQPIDFHPTRQLRSAIIARGMYYKLLPGIDPALRQQAVAAWNSTGQYEPSILEYVTARTYLLLGGEKLWAARLINSLLWLIGGLALFDLARRGLLPAGKSAIGAALVSLGYYLVLPFAVQASRSFQPDPGMVVWLTISVYFLFRWSEKPSWKWALLAGIFGGLAIFTKFVAAYILAVVAVTMVLFTLGLRRFWRNPQVWAMAVLMIVPSLVFYLNRQGRASEYFSDWTISLSHLLLQPDFYVRWLSLLQNLMGLATLILSLVGVLIAAPRYRALLLSLWGGYLLYGLFFPYQMYTHSYYHLQLVPIIALSLAPLAQVILDRLQLEKPAWKVMFAGIALVGILFTSWLSIATFKSADYRAEPEHWRRIAALLPVDGRIVALTQEYGYPLMYYGQRKVTLWPNRGERTLASLRGSQKEFADYFAKRTAGMSYFLITAFNQYNDQPDLKQMLIENYPILAEGDGYLIFDLESPLTGPGAASP
jgi:4-amino-4-deoxy-L-arabinose transferase-like glycosyltransferase